MFDLSGGSQNADEKLQRVAKACNLDEQALKAQWRDVFPRAEKLLKQITDINAKNKDAWALALERLCQHHYTRGQHPVEILREALVQYFSFGASSSGVEQGFSKSQWGFGTRRDAALHSTEEFSVKALLDLPTVAASQKDRLIRLARLSWVSCFGQSRSSTAERVDKGIKRQIEDKEAKPATEAAFCASADVVRRWLLGAWKATLMLLLTCTRKFGHESTRRNWNFNRGKLRCESFKPSPRILCRNTK